MYLHIGNEYALPAHWIVGIFDFNGTTSAGRENEQFLAGIEQSGRIEWSGNDVPKSFIVTLDRVYLSPVRSATLRLRWDRAYEEFLESKGNLNETRR